MCFGPGFGMRRYIDDRLTRVRVSVCRDMMSDRILKKTTVKSAKKQDASLYRMTHRASTGNKEFVSHSYLQNIRALLTLIIALGSSESYTKHNRIID